VSTGKVTALDDVRDGGRGGGEEREEALPWPGLLPPTLRWHPPSSCSPTSPVSAKKGGREGGGEEKKGFIRY